jgi:hypothetical protein
MEQASTMGVEIYGELLREATPHELSPETVRDRVQILQILGSLARTVGEPQVRGHLSPRRYAGVLADVLVAGLLHPERGEAS